jgi:hypothetical protein
LDHVALGYFPTRKIIGIIGREVNRVGVGFVGPLPVTLLLCAKTQLVSLLGLFEVSLYGWRALGT